MKAKPLIRVVVKKGLLYLSIPNRYYPPRYYALGLPDEPQYRVLANQLAFIIGIDCATNSFDSTFSKYSPRLQYISLIDLWEQYVLFKKQLLHPSSLRIFRAISNHLREMPPEILGNPPAIKIYFLKTLTQEQARRVMMHLKASCSWGVEMGFIPNNPFRLLAPISRVRTKGIDPFSKGEMRMILSAFSNNHYYSYYENLVRFVFLTGCRPSEAAGLTWEYISYDFKKITFKNVFVEGQIKNCTKTSELRHFPVNQQLKLLLVNLPRKTELVFPSKRGKYLNMNNFNRRAWHSVLKNLPIRYRPLYNCRHSFITWCLQDGINVATVAKWVGNTPRVIWDYYAGFVDDEVPLI